jgi:hypothetical protein
MFSKMVTGGVSWSLGPTGKLFLVPGKEKLNHPNLRYSLFDTHDVSEFALLPSSGDWLS